MKRPAIDERLSTESIPFDTLRESILRELRSSMPGEIVAFDPATQTATVQPLIRDYQEGDKGTEYVPLPLLQDVPVLCPGGGGYAITFPVKAGDECMLFIADRCMDAWFQSGGIQNPVVMRAHDISDAVAIVGFRSMPNALKDYNMVKPEMNGDPSIWGGGGGKVNSVNDVEPDEAGNVALKANEIPTDNSNVQDEISSLEEGIAHADEEIAAIDDRVDGIGELIEAINRAIAALPDTYLPLDGSKPMEGPLTVPDTINYKAQQIERLWSNPEILLNSDFRVWQFGTSGFTAPNVYTADMWIAKVNGSGYVFNISRRNSGGGIVIENNTTSAATMSLRQYMEDTSIIGKTVTLTVDADGFSSDPVTFVFQAAEAEILSDGNGNRVFTSGAGAYPYIAFHIDIGQTLRINSIHLEYGPVGTRYTPRHMAEELMLCQRYRQQIVLLNDAPWLYEGSTIRRYVYRWNPMRIAPTVDVSGATEMRIWAATGATSYLANNVKTDGCFVVATSPALAAANNCYLTGTIRLDANIY